MTNSSSGPNKRKIIAQRLSPVGLLRSSTFPRPFKSETPAAHVKHETGYIVIVLLDGDNCDAAGAFPDGGFKSRSPGEQEGKDG